MDNGRALRLGAIAILGVALYYQTSKTSPSQIPLNRSTVAGTAGLCI